ncbi:MAG: PKD domain-containing protein [Thermoplasmatota archaeon]
MLEKWKSDVTMKAIKSIILTAALLSYFVLAGTVGAESGTLTDPEDDVLMMSELDQESSTQTTDQRPNVDIIQISYDRTDADTEVTVTLKVKGQIEDKNDFEEVDINDTSFTGSMVTYAIYLETTETQYDIQYVNKNLTINYETGTAEVSDNELTVIFNLENVSETITNVTATTIAFDIKSLTDIKYYFDIAPDESLFMASASADPTSAKTGEDVSFDVEVEDLLGLTMPPYTYTWDFDDGGTGSGQSPTHSFDLAGEYQVEVTVEDSTGETATATTQVSVTKGTSDNNGGSTDNGDGSDSGDNGLLLFVGIIAIIVIIGIVALVFIIRR